MAQQIVQKLKDRDPAAWAVALAALPVLAFALLRNGHASDDQAELQSKAAAALEPYDAARAVELLQSGVLDSAVLQQCAKDADDETRLAAARRLSKSLLSTARSSGVVAFTSRAVAVWMVPGAPSVLTALGWTDALAFSGFERRGRLAVLAEAIEGRLARLTASWRGRYYQLEALGTAGEASVEAVTPVVRPVFDRADWQGLPCVAVASSPQVAEGLKAVGFKDAEQFTLFGAKLAVLIRQPKEAPPVVDVTAA